MTSLFYLESKRQVINNDCAIINCNFLNLFGVESGAAIYKEGEQKVEVISSIFNHCNSSEKGGSIFLEGGSFRYSSSCAEECILTVAKDNNFGNHIYADSQSEIMMANSGAFMCGPSDDVCGDSVVMFRTFSNMIVRDINHSYCSSLGGCSGISMGSPSSKIDYIRIYKGRDYHIHAIYSSVGKCYSSNIIAVGVHLKELMFYSYESSAWEISDSVILPENISNMVFINLPIFLHVFGNFSYENITYTSGFDIGLQNRRRGCTFLKTRNNRKTKFTIKILLSFQEIIPLIEII